MYMEQSPFTRVSRFHQSRFDTTRIVEPPPSLAVSKIARGPHRQLTYSIMNQSLWLRPSPGPIQCGTAQSLVPPLPARLPLLYLAALKCWAKYFLTGLTVSQVPLKPAGRMKAWPPTYVSALPSESVMMTCLVKVQRKRLEPNGLRCSERGVGSWTGRTAGWACGKAAGGGVAMVVTLGWDGGCTGRGSPCTLHPTPPAQPIACGGEATPRHSVRHSSSVLHH